jgi:hypothetical protein
LRAIGGTVGWGRALRASEREGLPKNSPTRTPAPPLSTVDEGRSPLPRGNCRWPSISASTRITRCRASGRMVKKSTISAQSWLRLSQYRSYVTSSHSRLSSSHSKVTARDGKAPRDIHIGRMRRDPRLQVPWKIDADERSPPSRIRDCLTLGMAFRRSNVTRSAAACRAHYRPTVASRWTSGCATASRSAWSRIRTRRSFWTLPPKLVENGTALAFDERNYGTQSTPGGGHG